MELGYYDQEFQVWDCGLKRYIYFMLVRNCVMIDVSGKFNKIEIQGFVLENIFILQIVI